MRSFYDLHPPARYEDADVVVLPVPYESSTSYGQGAREGPRAILEASAQVETFDEECDLDLETAAPTHTMSPVEHSGSAESLCDRLETKVGAILDAGKFPLVLGGEHTVSIGPIRAAARRFADLCVVQIDAHADLRAEYQGNAFSHASVMARIVEQVRLWQFGVRALSKEEAAFIKASPRVRCLFAHEILADPARIGAALADLGEHVYLTIDVDGIDPSVIRSTGTPVPGGLSYHQVLEIARFVTGQRTLVGADVVELAPREGDHASDFAAALLVSKIIAFRAHAKRGRR